MKRLRNENGVTLIEVLVAMTILAIILISIMMIFPQMGMMNKFNIDKTQAMNSAKEILVKWSESSTVQTFLDNQNPEIVKSVFDVTEYKIDEVEGYYYFVSTRDPYKVIISIKIDPSNESKTISLHTITVQLLDKQGKEITKTYGYIEKRG